MRQLFIKTDKHFITPLPRYAYDGKIAVIQGTSEAERAVAALRRSPLLGIDTETRPAFRRGEQHAVALLQVANDDLCFLFRLNAIGFLPCLADLLSDPQVLKVGLSLQDDFHMLRQRQPSFTPGGCIDLQQYAKEMGIEDMSLQKLYANVFHHRISKGAQLSNWEADVLSESQRVYAATDAVSCIQLYRTLKDLRETGNYELVSSSPDMMTPEAQSHIHVTQPA